MTTSAQYGEFTFVRMLGKAVQHLTEHGPAFALRRAIWRLQYERLQRLRNRRQCRREAVPSVIRLQGKEFELHPSLRGLSEELLLFATHEPVATKFYLQQLSPGDHVVDVGSNIGYYLLMATTVVGASGRILGFEPASDVYDILQRNIKRLGRDNVQVFPWAIGARCEITQFYQSEVPNWGSLIRDDRLLPTQSTAVQVKRVDDILREFPGFHPTVLRMDVEGGELMVLEGAREVLREYKPCLFIEIHTFALGWESVRRELVGLRDLGYSSGMLIERSWDQPWISKWMRERRRWTGRIDTLIRRIESPRDPLVMPTLTLFLRKPGA